MDHWAPGTQLQLLAADLAIDQGAQVLAIGVLILGGLKGPARGTVTPQFSSSPTKHLWLYSKACEFTFSSLKTRRGSPKGCAARCSRILRLLPIDTLSKKLWAQPSLP
jgi:hypothetical protein